MEGLSTLITLFIENYDVSDIINQTAILVLLLSLLLQRAIRIRSGKSAYDY